MILPAFRRNPNGATIRALYGAIVAQARSPAFYTAYGVPDTVEGRFELIVLHLVLLMRRLDGQAAAAGVGRGRGLGQGLFDVFCSDLDSNLREMGVGDFAVPKRMRRFGEAFYGRQRAYDAAAAVADARELEKALARNIFGVADIDDRAARLARYVSAATKQLDAEDAGTLLAGRLTFPDPEAFAHAPS
jgi:cytochrome b pre-mRNA-processing protein 3